MVSRLMGIRVSGFLGIEALGEIHKSKILNPWAEVVFSVYLFICISLYVYIC